MITNNGITLLGKYLVGQIPSFASHIAIGCGPNTLGSDESFGDYSAKASLDFEVDRFPIISRTTNVIDGEKQIIFTAEVPSDVRHGITEVGVYPSESNNIFGSIPSQTIFSFTTNEGWQKSLSSTVTDVEVESDIIDETTQDIDTTAKAFFLASDNAIFRSADRLDRREQPRFLNSSVVVRGDLTAIETATITGASASGTSIVYTATNTFAVGDLVNISGITPSNLNIANAIITARNSTTFTVASTETGAYVSGGTAVFLDTAGDHIIISQPLLPELDSANPFEDELKLVFSVIGQDLAASTPPTSIRIAIVFYAGSETARYSYWGTATSNNTRYIYDSNTLDDLTISSGFAWRDVTSVKIFANADTSSATYIALDGFRFENLSSVDDRYSLAGYTKLKLSDVTAAGYPRPIEKAEGSTTYIEFRFALDVS